MWDLPDGVRKAIVWLVHVCGCKSRQFTILHILGKQSVVKTSLLHSSESNLYSSSVLTLNESFRTTVGPMYLYI